MPRSPLVHFKGALFHVTARGNNKQIIFQNERDFERYLQAVKKCKEQLPFYLYAFTLMPNHIHLLIEVINAPISNIMQKIQTAYTMYANRKYGTVGHVFQGRYFWLLVEKESHLLELIRYIHLNPVRAGFVKNPSEYHWSSHNVYLNKDNETKMLINKEGVLPLFSRDSSQAIKKYEEFALAGTEKYWKDFAQEIQRGYILGTPKFVKKIEKKILNKNS